MNKRQKLIRIGSASAAVGAVMLLLMALLPWPFTFPFPGEKVLSGQVTLSYGETGQYVSAVKRILVCDTVFIASWLVAWPGLFLFVSSRKRSLAWTILILGLMAATFDIVETMIVFSLVESVRFNVGIQTGWLTLWKIVNTLSYLLMFAAGFLTAICLQNRNWLEKIMGFIGVFFAIPAVVGLLIEVLFPLTYFWFFSWFICLSLLLWRQGAANAGN